MTHISHIEHSLEMRGPRKRAPHIWRAVCNMLSACEYEDSVILHRQGHRVREQKPDPA